MVEFDLLNRTSIRQEVSGRSVEYYQLFEQLGDYSESIFGHLGIKPLSVEVKSGEMGAVLITKTSTDQFVLKICLPGSDLFGVTFFYEKLEKTGIAAPKSLSFGNSQKIVPFDFQLMSFIPGKELVELDPQYHYPGGVLMGEEIEKVHQIKVEGFGSPNCLSKWSASSWLESLDHEYGFEIKNGGHLVFSEQEKEMIESLTLKNSRLAIDQAYLIHGDVGDRNGLYTILDDDLRLEGIIDPGVIQGGDPLFDLANVLGNENQFAIGFKQGYFKDKKLSSEEEYRLAHLKLFCSYWTACWQAVTQQDFGKKKEQVLRQLAELR